MLNELESRKKLDRSLQITRDIAHAKEALRLHYDSIKKIESEISQLYASSQLQEEYIVKLYKTIIF